MLLVGFVTAPPSLAAPLCQLDSGAHTLTVTNQGSGLVIENSGTGNLLVNGVTCAVISSIDLVNIDIAGLDGDLIMSLIKGPLGPGFTDEGNGSSELEFDVVGVSLINNVVIQGTPGNDGIAVGQRFLNLNFLQHLNLNQIADGSTRDVDVTLHGVPGQLAVVGHEGDDILTGAGTGGFGGDPYGALLVLDDGAGSDQVTGGSGNDTLLVELQDAADTVSGGSGLDQVLLVAQLGTSSEVTLDDLPNDGTICAADACSHDNILSDIEILRGQDGNDRIVGAPGTQTIRGGAGSDQLFGGDGNDELSGESGADALDGGSGNDTLSGGTSGDVLLGQGGIDTASYSASGGGVFISLNASPDDGVAGEGDSVSNDIEVVIGSPYADTLIGNAGGQSLEGGLGNDVLDGRRGNDTLFGGDDADNIRGGMGDDSLRGGSASDVLRGDAGTDIVTYAASSAGVFVSLNGVADDGAVGEGDNVRNDVERVLGSSLADKFFGNGAANYFSGGSGNDVLKGRGGADRLFGRNGNDTFNGGPGRDRCVQGPGVGPKTSCELL